MLRKMTLAALIGGALTLSSGVSLAQDLAVLDDLYGRGVHAFFSHDSRRAYDLLTQAIDNGSRDPRAYYFRGLALRSLGRDDDARLDFRTGAEIEAGGEELRNMVSRSLERVQGPTRLELEGVRKLARLTVRNQRLEREERRYQQLQDAEREVLRSPPAARPAPRPAAPLPETARPDATDPFSEGPEAAVPPPRPAAPATPAPAPPPAPAPAPAPAPTEADPFGEAPAAEPAPAPARPAPPPAPAPAPAPAEEDPFGEAPAAPAPAPAAPAPAPAPAEESDPFGEPAPAPAPEKPAEEKPAEPADSDPFAAGPATTEPAATTAAKPARAGSSLFRALGKALLSGDEAQPGSPTVKDSNVRPALNVQEATDPFADDPEPAAASAEAAKPAEKPADDPFAEDPFK